MKKALLLCCSFLLWAAQLLAAPANVNFISERGIPFKLIFDGRMLTRRVAREVYLDRVRPGTHWAEFRIPAGRGYVNYRTKVFLDAGYETNYVLVTRQGYAPVLRKASAVPMRGEWRRNPRYDDYPGPYGNPDPRYDDRDDDRNGRYDNRDQDREGNYGNRDQDRPDRDGRYDDRRDDREDDRRPDYYNGQYRSLMSSADVDALLRVLDKKPFDSEKLPIAKEALAQSAIRTEELKRLLKGFDFESQRLEMAKYSYEHVADPQNFYQVYELFNFDSNVKELQQYSAQSRPADDYRNNYPVVLKSQEVEALVRAAERKAFDKDKLVILQDGVSRAALRTEDLKRLLRVFSFEDQRVALAKYAYGRLIDPQNFYQVYELFSFNSNVKELQEYVSQQPRR
ncbi:DUF4476 domain-containing protein [Hymenobacter lutimineralis]|uniref:DUF4476 domain-containing protein n=1 Tax=Hymenobacter lutimineralis TaxID=2606448 RepID=A0A5D6V661_9BACT|nr:DUF4476 domain-containing protein [Hymenobacter lutimineralis]TYZ11501.1 DUF4476 domain-containing protein [Hymenobacter lutimineralis]